MIMKKLGFIRYNSPVVLTFAFVSLAVLILDFITGGKTTALLFCVYNSPLTNPFTYPRMFLHVLGHANLEHYMNNILLMLVIGPPLEEKYGSRALLMSIAITALVSGVFQFVFFPHTALLGASGIVFMMIVMSSLAGFREGSVPLTLILVVVFYLGNEIISGIISADNVSQLTHVIGGVCGAVIGWYLSKRRLRR